MTFKVGNDFDSRSMFDKKKKKDEGKWADEFLFAQYRPVSVSAQKFKDIT